MKQRIVLLIRDERVYLRELDIKTLKPLLDLAKIKVKTTQKGKYTGAPRHYVPLDDVFFFLSLDSDYEIVIHH